MDVERVSISKQLVTSQIKKGSHVQLVLSQNVREHAEVSIKMWIGFRQLSSWVYTRTPMQLSTTFVC